MPNIDCGALTVFAPPADHGGMGPFMRPLLPITQNEVGNVIRSGSTQVYGLSPYVPNRSVKPLLKLEHEGGWARAVATMREPHVVIYENVLTKSECRRLIKFASRRLEKSTVVDHDSGEGVFHPIRTSSGMYFKKNENALISRIDRRLAALMQWPEAMTEPLSLLKYKPGEFYDEHYDFFDYHTAGSAINMANGGNRVGTLLLYLNDCEEGGSTMFADVGLEVLPRAGYAAFFGYANPHFSSLTRHAGRPPVRGVKWIATRWLKEGMYGHGQTMDEPWRADTPAV